MKPYLSIAAIYRDEGPYLREWIEFHRLVGVERFFLYNNRSTDDHLEVLAPYIDGRNRGVGGLPGVPGPAAGASTTASRPTATTRAGSRSSTSTSSCSRPPSGPVGEILRDVRGAPRGGRQLLVFGTSGHQTPPPGLVIENYRRRLGLDRPRSRVGQVHRRPERGDRAREERPLLPLRHRRKAVDELQRARTGATTTESLSVDLLRINHYFTRSQEERERKLAAPRVDNGRAEEPEGVEERDRRLNEEPDDTILAYLPALTRCTRGRMRILRVNLGSYRRSMPSANSGSPPGGLPAGGIAGSGTRTRFHRPSGRAA